MKKSRRYSEQVAFGLCQAEDGTPVSEVCRKDVGEPAAHDMPVNTGQSPSTGTSTNESIDRPRHAL